MNLEQLSTLYLPAVEAELQSVVALAGDGPFAEYRQMLTYHMGWSGDGAGPMAAGKRIRPLLVELACHAVADRWEPALPAAAAVELIHNFSLIHDDIQDDSPLRRGRPTVWKTWGIAQAINAGDALFSLARISIHRLTQRALANDAVLQVMGVLDQTCLRLTQGQFLDMSFEGRMDLRQDEYWMMIEGKTAALVEACAEIGALIGGAPTQTVADLREFGRGLGLAFQVRDDILGIWGKPEVTGKSAASDLLTRKKSLPVIIGLECSEEFRRLYAMPASPQDDVDRMAALLDECGARGAAEAQAARWTGWAHDHFERARPSGPAAEALLELAEQLLNRKV